MSSLSHSMTWRSSMARRLDRHQLVEPVMRQHEAARMLTEMARKADQLARQFQGEAQPPVGEIQIEFGRLLLGHAVFRPAPDLRGEG